MLNYDDFVNVKIIKVKDELGKFTHWEYEVRFDDIGAYAGGGTAPTFSEAFEDSYKAVRNVAYIWMSSDANVREDE